MSLPITQKQAYKVATWMKSNFGDQITRALRGTPFDVNTLCGIACQETAYFWISFIDKMSVEDVLARCVLDASGDFPGTQRSAFPRNTEAFRKRYSGDFADMLIAEANKTRKLRGFGPQQWVYKGYGIYQYDLQFVVDDEIFFREKQWFSFEACLERAKKELLGKYKIYDNLWKAVRGYNGSGSAATDYANNVTQFAKYFSEV